MSFLPKLCAVGVTCVGIGLAIDLMTSPTPALETPTPDSQPPEENVFGIKPYQSGEGKAIDLLPSPAPVPTPPPTQPKPPKPSGGNTTISSSLPNTINTSNAYINRVYPLAKRLNEQRGIPISMTIALARHETGNGRSVIAQNNHWGIKCLGNDCVTVKTQEEVGGVKRFYNLKFESCNDVDRCLRILANTFDNLLIKGGGNKTLYRTNPDEAFRAIHRGGYATDSNWSNAVVRIRQETERILGRP